VREKGADESTAGGTPASLRIESADLFNGRREVVIVHHGTEYRLHITKAGKLILTK
jgi:hemin uptake protein HemP